MSRSGGGTGFHTYVLIQEPALMKILSIIGARRSGNTSEVVTYFEEQLARTMPVEYERLYLCDHGLEFCIGCHACIFTGEHGCPHAAAVKTIEDRMMAADGLVLASPGYMFSVTGIMKTFLDHVAYNCHRPKYFGKKIYLLSACIRWQRKSVFAPMETWASAAEFAKALTSPREHRPDFGSVVIFHAFRTLARLAPTVLKADKRYFDSRNAYDSQTRFYVPSKVPFAMHLAANYIEKRIEHGVRRGTDMEALQAADGAYRNKLAG